MEQRLNGLDILKCICAFLVVCIHVAFRKNFGASIVPLCKCAVPVFIMITGYFFEQMYAKQRVKKQIITCLKLYVFGLVFYAIMYLLIAIKNHTSVYEFFRGFFTPVVFRNFIIFNEPILAFADHLWYLGAIIYVLLFALLMKKWKLSDYMIYFVWAFLLFNLILGLYSEVLGIGSIKIGMARNWMFVGIPYFYFGNYMYKKREKIERIPKLLLWTLLIFASVGACVEEYIFVTNGPSFGGDNYIFTPVAAISLFMIFLFIRGDGKIGNLLGRIGRNEATGIYIIHFFFITNLRSLFNRLLGNSFVADLIYALSVYLISLILIIGYKKLLGLLRKNKKRGE